MLLVYSFSEFLEVDSFSFLDWVVRFYYSSLVELWPTVFDLSFSFNGIWSSITSSIHPSIHFFIHSANPNCAPTVFQALCSVLWIQWWGKSNMVLSLVELTSGPCYSSRQGMTSLTWELVRHALSPVTPSPSQSEAAFSHAPQVSWEQHINTWEAQIRRTRCELKSL